MSTTSRIPAFIDGLYTTAKAALPAVTVIDGPPLDWDPLATSADVSEDDFLFVGARPEDDTSAAGGEDRDDYGTGSEESSAVYCTAVSYRGDQQTMKAARDAAFATVAAVRTAVRTDQTLAGAVGMSWVSAADRVEQIQDDHGLGCRVVFTVTGQALLN